VQLGGLGVCTDFLGSLLYERSPLSYVCLQPVARFACRCCPYAQVLDMVVRIELPEDEVLMFWFGLERGKLLIRPYISRRPLESILLPARKLMTYLEALMLGRTLTRQKACIYVSLCVCLCLSVSASVYVCASVRLCVCASVRLCVCASVRLCACECARVCVCACVRVCVCACVRVGVWECGSVGVCMGVGACASLCCVRTNRLR
jgi:hypothetical protein